MKKITNYINAVQRLAEAAQACSQNDKNTVLRDGLIQRFEFTFELSWKALKEYMTDQGVKKEFQFPKQVLKTAYENNIIHDEKTWNEMLDARNATSHIYDDKVAERIGNCIRENYLVVLDALATYFKDHT